MFWAISPRQHTTFFSVSHDIMASVSLKRIWYSGIISAWASPPDDALFTSFPSTMEWFPSVTDFSVRFTLHTSSTASLWSSDKISAKQLFNRFSQSYRVQIFISACMFVDDKYQPAEKLEYRLWQENHAQCHYCVISAGTCFMGDKMYPHSIWDQKSTKTNTTCYYDQRIVHWQTAPVCRSGAITHLCFLSPSSAFFLGIIHLYFLEALRQTVKISHSANK